MMEKNNESSPETWEKPESLIITAIRQIQSTVKIDFCFLIVKNVFLMLQKIEK